MAINIENEVSKFPQRIFTSERRLFLCLEENMGEYFRTISTDLKTSDLK